MVQTPGSGFNGTTWSGYVIYWVTFGVMAGSALIFAAMTYTKPQRHRKHGCELVAHASIVSSFSLRCVTPVGGQRFGLPLAASIMHSWFAATPLYVCADCTTLIVTIAAIAYYAMVRLTACHLLRLPFTCIPVSLGDIVWLSKAEHGDKVCRQPTVVTITSMLTTTSTVASTHVRFTGLGTLTGFLQLPSYCWTSYSWLECLWEPLCGKMCMLLRPMVNATWCMSESCSANADLHWIYWITLTMLFRIIVADILMIITGLAGAINTHQAKWGWYAFGCFFQVVLTIGLVFPGMKAAFSRGGGISKVYAGLAAYLAVLWWGYPIVWGLAEGSNTISSDAEVCALPGVDMWV